MGFFSDTICVSLQSEQYKKDVGTSTTLKHRKKDTSTKEVFHSYPTLEKTIVSIILLKLPPFHSLDVIFSLNWNHLKTIGKQIYREQFKSVLSIFEINIFQVSAK